MNTLPPRSAPSRTRCLVLGLLAGAAWGWIEVRYRLSESQDPSVLRRSGSLITYCVTWSAVAGILACSFAGAVARLALRERWRVAREGATPVFLGALVALAGPTLTIGWLADSMTRQSLTIRVFVVLLSTLAASLTGWVLARRLAGRPGVRTTLVLRALSTSRFGALALAVATVAGLALSRPSPQEVRAEDLPEASGTFSGPDVLLVAIEGLRADAFFSESGWNLSTPHLDRLRALGTAFEDALAPSPRGPVSLASLWTSTHPFEHAVHPARPSVPVPDTNLGSLLRRAGLRCSGAGGRNSALLHATNSPFESFDVYEHALEERLTVARLFDRTLRLFDLTRGPARTIPWIEARFPFVATRRVGTVEDRDVNRRLQQHAWPRGDASSFLFVHYGALPEQALPDGGDRVRRYAEAVEETDEALGELLSALSRTRRLEEMWIVVVGLSGAALGEHGDLAQERNLHEEALRVPMLFAGPGIPAGRVVEGRATLLDVAPTLLELSGLQAEPAFRGRSLAPLFAPEPTWIEQPAFAETAADGERRFGAALGDWKLIRAGDALDVFDLARDPEETTALAVVPPELAPLQRALDAFVSLPRPHEGHRPNEQELASLRIPSPEAP